MLYLAIIRIKHMSKKELCSLIDQIISNEKFISEVRKCVDSCKTDLDTTDDKPTFAFQKASKGWTLDYENLPVEGERVVQDISDLMTTLIDNNLHAILSKQFLNVSNEILVIRQEMNVFTQEQQKRTMMLKEQFCQQMEILKKKMVLQQSLASNKETYFVRSRVNATLGSTASSLTGKGQKQQTKAELSVIKKEIETIKANLLKQEGYNYITEKLLFLQEKLQTEIMNMRLRIEDARQKSKIEVSDLAAQLKENSSKDFIGQEVKRAVKSHFKVYLEEINACKIDRMRLHQAISHTDKGLQDYFANQLKPLWLLIQDLKKRLKNIQQECSLANQSFLLQ